MPKPPQETMKESEMQKITARGNGPSHLVPDYATYIRQGVIRAFTGPRLGNVIYNLGANPSEALRNREAAVSAHFHSKKKSAPSPKKSASSPKKRCRKQEPTESEGDESDPDYEESEGTESNFDFDTYEESEETESVRCFEDVASEDDIPNPKRKIHTFEACDRIINKGTTKSDDFDMAGFVKYVTQRSEEFNRKLDHLHERQNDSYEIMRSNGIETMFEHQSNFMRQMCNRVVELEKRQSDLREILRSNGIETMFEDDSNFLLQMCNRVAELEKRLAFLLPEHLESSPFEGCVHEAMVAQAIDDDNRGVCEAVAAQTTDEDNRVV